MGGSCSNIEHDDADGLEANTGAVHMLVIALDYKYAENGKQLTSSMDAIKMVKIAERAGVQDLTVITDRNMGQPGFPVRERVLRSLREVASRCQPGDWFVWFYAGHGITVPDSNGDESDGEDEAFMTPDLKGKLTAKALLLDDDFSEAIDSMVPAGVKVLVLCDCCHSGSICDIDSHKYLHDIYSLSAARDNQEAEDTGSGGVLTEGISLAVEELATQSGLEPYSIQTIFRSTSRIARRIITSNQNLCFQYHGQSPNSVAWPLASNPSNIQGNRAKADIRPYDQS